MLSDDPDLKGQFVGFGSEVDVVAIMFVVVVVLAVVIAVLAVVVVVLAVVGVVGFSVLVDGEPF